MSDSPFVVGTQVIWNHTLFDKSIDLLIKMDKHGDGPFMVQNIRTINRCHLCGAYDAPDGVKHAALCNNQFDDHEPVAQVLLDNAGPESDWVWVDVEYLRAA